MFLKGGVSTVVHAYCIAIGKKKSIFQIRSGKIQVLGIGGSNNILNSAGDGLSKGWDRKNRW
jgi:hypothetical protein